MIRAILSWHSPAFLHTRYLPRSAPIQFHDITWHYNMPYRLITACALRPQLVHTNRPYLLCSVAIALYSNPQHNLLSMHAHSTCTTHPAPPNPQPSIVFLCTNTRQDGTRYRDGVKVLWCRSHLVWLVFVGSIPTCACFHFCDLASMERYPWLYISVKADHCTACIWVITMSA